MFDKRSDFALNKLDPNAIVCRSVTGTHTRLTRDDFDSEAEFLEWKHWSDGDYKDTEVAGRDFDENCVSLNESIDTTGISAEDALIAAFQEDMRTRYKPLIDRWLRAYFTETQLRRLRMYYAERLTVTAIASKEKTTKAAISISLRAARKKFPAFCSEVLNKLPF